MQLRQKFRSLLWATALLLSFATVEAGKPAGEMNATRAELYYGLAKGNYLVGDMAGAKSALSEALRIAPENHPALALRARILLDEDQPDAALDTTSSLLDREPDKMEYRLLHALALSNLERKDEALSVIESVLRDAPATNAHRAIANQMLGLLRMSEGNWEAAAAAFGQAYDATVTGSASSRALAGEAYTESASESAAAGDYEKAIADYTKAVELSDGESGGDLKWRHRLLMDRARLLARTGETDAAINDLQTVTGQNPGQAEASTLLASLYAATERWEALDGLLPFLGSQPGLKDIALYLEGRSAFAKGRIGTARTRFEEAMDLISGSENLLLPALRFHHGACLIRLGRSEAGDAEILDALAAGFVPEAADEAIIAGTVLLRAKRPAEAIELIEPVAIRSPMASVRLWSTLGRAHQAAGHRALALSALSKGIELAPDDDECRALRAALLRSLNDFDGAAADYEIALRSAPGNGAYAYALGLVRLQQGAIPEAESRLGLAADMLEDNASVQLLHALLALALDKTGAAGKSLLRYQSALGDRTPNESALLIAYCLDRTNDPDSALLRFDTAIKSYGLPASSGLHLYRGYFEGSLAEDDLLNRAGRADTPDAATRQICETAFWMAQHERISGNTEKARSLLRIITGLGLADLPEYLIARWQLEQDAE